ncbi:hypothetical protein ND748_11305 [Frankia sp. AiPs1]|uniref:hypothetical protein n=1 Tax=Frankia sp. AiPs1 TaxID=573493 RepID=UPI002043C9D5|nr:hypothetical protein [Frankia sp. AiPs1]MCM3922241.1 hypothetical protein [Frankia sp. AiPs1]
MTEKQPALLVDFNDLVPNLTLSVFPEDFDSGVPVAGTRVRVTDGDGNSADAVILQVARTTFTDGYHDD